MNLQNSILSIYITFFLQSYCLYMYIDFTFAYYFSILVF